MVEYGFDFSGGRFWTQNLLGRLNKIATTHTHKVTIVPDAYLVGELGCSFLSPSIASNFPSKCMQVDPTGRMGVRMSIGIAPAPAVATT